MNEPIILRQTPQFDAHGQTDGWAIEIDEEVAHQISTLAGTPRLLRALEARLAALERTDAEAGCGQLPPSTRSLEAKLKTSEEQCALLLEKLRESRHEKQQWETALQANRSDFEGILEEKKAELRTVKAQVAAIAELLKYALERGSVPFDWGPNDAWRCNAENMLAALRPKT